MINFEANKFNALTSQLNKILVILSTMNIVIFLPIPLL